MPINNTIILFIVQWAAYDCTVDMALKLKSDGSGSVEANQWPSINITVAATHLPYPSGVGGCTSPGDEFSAAHGHSYTPPTVQGLYRLCQIKKKITRPTSKKRKIWLDIMY